MTGDSLRVLVAHHRWWYPTAVSGADLANHEFARKLVNRGVPVQVQGIMAPGMTSRISHRDYRIDGVPVSLVSSDFTRALGATVRAFKPNVVLTSCPEPGAGPDDVVRMVESLRRYKLPVVLYIHDLDATLPLFEKVKNRLALLIANSRFNADRVKQIWGMDCEVVYPVSDWKSVDAGGVHGPFITFFHPVPQKGLSVAHALVTRRFADRPFLFVEGFLDPESHGIELIRSGNLVHARRSPAVASIYMMTRLVIIPSQWEEPFGRVALEAMNNRIPVIASKTGGLVESVGDGGILIEDFGNVQAWVEAIESLDDSARRRQLIQAGQRHAKQFSLDDEVDKLLECLNKACTSSSSNKGSGPAEE